MRAGETASDHARDGNPIARLVRPGVQLGSRRLGPATCERPLVPSRARVSWYARTWSCADLSTVVIVTRAVTSASTAIRDDEPVFHVGIVLVARDRTPCSPVAGRVPQGEGGERW